MTFRADLHCHTIYSDGSESVEALIDLAVASQLQGLSITDHDTIAAYAEAIPYAKKKGILLGTGVEFSCIHREESIHVLAYGFPADSKEIATLCEMHQKRRKERNWAILKKLERLGMPLAEEELPHVGTIGRPHIAKLLVDKGFVPTLQEAFRRYIGEGKPCYERGTLFSVEETLEIIHRSHAKAFIAHPHLFKKASSVRKILDLPFDGLECYYAKCPPYEEARWVKLAQERGLLVSGGSDFHGKFKPHIPLGSSWVDEQAFRKIFGG